MAGVPAHNHHQTFEGIKLLDDDGSEFWFARELAPLLDYPHWHNFARLIEKAKLACQRSGQKVADHFYETVKLVELGSGAERRVTDHRLSRYACYLLVQNGDPSKPVIANGANVLCCADTPPRVGGRSPPWSAQRRCAPPHAARRACRAQQDTDERCQESRRGIHSGLRHLPGPRL
ncbi:BRO family protein [Ralstonia sp. Ralssp110]|uniref:BRO family protein n=1 Tax=Ralstonia sp. Ralssp110 TaxID=3243004 RepID=UPI0039B4BF99